MPAARAASGGLERSLSATGNFGAGSGSGALMKGSRFAADSMLEGGGFEPPVPRQRRHPSATANHLASYHLPRKLGLRFAPKASTPSRKSSEPRRPGRKRLTGRRELLSPRG